MTNNMPTIVFTGEGKGKTSAALGIIIRALGQGKKVSAIFFFKGWWTTGEQVFLSSLKGYSKKLTLNYVPIKKWVRSPDEKTKKILSDGVNLVLSEIKKKPFLVVVDEVITAYALGLLPEEELKRIVAAAKSGNVALVLTGRGWPVRLNKMVEVVSEIKKLKHWFDDGKEAVKGLDW